jgi:hypothetical protein
MTRIREILVVQKKHLRFGDWHDRDVCNLPCAARDFYSIVASRSTNDPSLTDVMIFKIFSTKNLAKQLAVLCSNYT